MRAFRTALLLALPALALLAACGGDDDSDDAGGDASSGSTKGAKSSSGGATIPTIKDGNFTEGTVSLQVSGGQDLKVDAKGNGIANGGFALLTFANDEATVILSIQGGSKDEPGGIAITTKKFATAGDWNKECTLSVNDGATELKGEFSCKDIDAVDPTSAKTYKLRATGKFTVRR